MCYSVLSTLPLIFFKKKYIYIINAIKVVLELFNLAKQLCNIYKINFLQILMFVRVT